jgi:hypothetical protein
MTRLRALAEGLRGRLDGPVQTSLEEWALQEPELAIDTIRAMSDDGNVRLTSQEQRELMDLAGDDTIDQAFLESLGSRRVQTRDIRER